MTIGRSILLIGWRDPARSWTEAERQPHGYSPLSRLIELEAFRVEAAAEASRDESRVNA